MSHTFANESISSYHTIFHNHQAASSTSLQRSYCALPTLHSHAELQVPAHLWALFGPASHEDEEIIVAGQQDDKQTNGMTESTKPSGSGAHAEVKLDQAASGGRSNQANELDPYIDVVPVKGRTNNKRGERVRAASGVVSSQRRHALVGVKSTRDHVPDSSYYSKSVHIEESKGASHEWDYSSGDSSDDDDDDDGDDGDHHAHTKHGHHLYKGGKKHSGGHKRTTSGHHAKKMRKRKRRPKKKVHVVKVHQKPLDHHGGHYKPRPKKKVIYVKYKKPEKKYYEHDSYYHHDHHYDNHYEDEHHDKHKHKHHHHDKGSKGTTVHQVNLISKGKMSLAGILGQTLLCVNYLLVLKQPTYDKYTQHYHTRYAPYGGSSKGDTVEIKSGGPIILAHCGELPDARALVHINNRHRRSPAGLAEDAANGHRNRTGEQLALAPEQSQNSSSSLTRAEQQQQQQADYSRLASIAPPSYYYTLWQPSSRDYLARSSNFRDQQVVARTDGASLLSPIQSILSRLLFNGQSSSYADPSSIDSAEPIQVLGAPRANRGRVRTAGLRVQDNLSGEQLAPLQRQVQVFTGNPVQPLVRGQQNFVAGGQRVALVAPGGRRVILVDGQPQLVQARDNLIDMRTRRIEIDMRVTEGRRFGLPQRALRLTAPAAAAGNLRANGDDRVRRRPLGLAVQAPERLQMQNDQPASETDGEVQRPVQRQQQQGDTNNSDNSDNQSSLGRVALDLPEYALTGDSLELTCNHRVQLNRLYSVKWFKDTVEFYRFIPQNLPSKSSLVLPDVRVDLERSSSQSVHLRNVTHQTSGLYRCEVISEAPNFELLSGERRMRVYTLPDTGPRLSVLDPDEPATTVTTVLGANGRLRTINNLLAAPFANGANRPGAEREEDNDDDDDNDVTANRMRGPQQQQQQPTGGPLVRCASDRSDPVAQLRFFVNNRQVPVARTLENSTLSYSDGLEANVISFRVQLSDFVLDAAQQRNSLDRAASLKSSADNNNNNNNNSTTTTSTTTTTTTTRRPIKLAVESKKKKNGELKQKKTKKKTARPETSQAGKQDNDKPNASVHFDDQAEFGADKPKRAGENRKRPGGESVRAAGQRTLMTTDHQDAHEEDEVAASARQADTVRDAQQPPLPAADKTDQQLGRAESNRRVSSPSSPANDKSNKLAKGEQRTVTSSIGSGNAQQQQQRMYSNFIRIKCASTVPTLGYEMISELQVPLTLLVPASQLSDALRQANGLEQDPGPSQDDPAEGPRQQLSNGGSLQQPRTVLVDRLAQASRSTAAAVLYDDRVPLQATTKPGQAPNEGSRRARIHSRQTHVSSGSATSYSMIREANVLMAVVAAILGRWSIEMSLRLS